MIPEHESWNTYLETPPNFPREPNPPVFPFGHGFPFDLIYDEEEEVTNNNYSPTSIDSLNALSPIIFPPGIGSVNTGEFENRIISVSNLPFNMARDDLMRIFAGYGDIEKVDLEDINKGVARIHYFDIRSSQWARSTEIRIGSKLVFKSYAPLEEVTNPRKPPNNGTIVLFHLPKLITDDELSTVFLQFGEIRQIRSTPSKQNQKFVEYYDIRNAELALKTMNGQPIKNSRVSIEFSLPGGFRKNAIVFNKSSSGPTIERNYSKGAA